MIPLLLSTLVLAQEPDASAEAPSAESAAPVEEVSEEAAPAEDAAPTEDAVSDEPAEPRWDLPDIAGQIGPDSPHWDLEVMYHNAEYKGGLIKTKARILQNPGDPDLYWIAARFQFEIGEQIDRTDTSIDKEAFYKQMLDYTDKGLAVSPGNPHLLYAKGIALGRYGTTRGVLSTLFLAEEVEETWLQVANSGFTYRSIAGEEWLPCDVHICLSIFYRLVPDSWLVQAVAGTRGSMDKSMSHILKANQCSGGAAIGTVKELGVVQLCQGQKNDDSALVAKGEQTLRYLLTLPANRPSEHTDHRHARMLLANPDIACGYSRDGQQDLDESKLEG